MRTPDLFVHELQRELWDAFGIDITLNTITLVLKSRGFSRKKVRCIGITLDSIRLIVMFQITRQARERKETARWAYLAKIAEHYQPEQLVFVDESACNRHTCNRTYAWAPSGTRARRRDCFVRGRRYGIKLFTGDVLTIDLVTLFFLPSPLKVWYILILSLVHGTANSFACSWRRFSQRCNHSHFRIQL